MVATLLSLPRAGSIPSQLLPNLQILLSKARADLSQLLVPVAQSEDWAWIHRLESLEDKITRFWAPVRHLHAVCETEELRSAYLACLPWLVDWQAEIHQNLQLYQALLRFSQHPDWEQWEPAQQMLIKNNLRDFRLSGVTLNLSEQTQYRHIKAQLEALGVQFESNLLDANYAGALSVTETQLAGVPPSIIATATAEATARGLSGALLNLDGPCYQAILSSAEDRELRATFYRAWVTRASEAGDARFDNGPIMLEILRKRHALSLLLGFNNPAELSLATDKMVGTTQEVIRFLTDLLTPARQKASLEIESLQDFAKQQGQIEKLSSWDVPFWSEKFKLELFKINDAQLRPYFPIYHVLKGLFALLMKLFQIHIKPTETCEVWHPDVQVFVVYVDRDLRGYLYLDLYARPHKREGAWMDVAQPRRLRKDGTFQHPIAFVTCNFSAAAPDTPALLLHEDVVTLFHEMGHALHHVLTQINYVGVSGTQGVAWDAVEFPSQFLECFAWEPLVLQNMSCHYQTREALNESDIQALQASRAFQSGMQLLKQLELALFDFRLHLEFDPNQDQTQIQKLLDEIREQTSLLPTPRFNRFQNGFAHIFADSYAAGYYSYLWAEVLAADAFGRFQEEGTLNPMTGLDFLKAIWEQGGSMDMLNLFQQFRHRLPNAQAFLVQRGF